MLTLSSFAQRQVPGLEVWVYSVKVDGGEIEYVRVGPESEEPQKTLVFLQGSQPKPLVFKLGETHVLNLPFDFNKLELGWNLVMISPPETPTIVAQDHLNPEYNYIPDPKYPAALSKAYLEANVLQTYVDRVDAVLADLAQQPWVKKDDIHLIGHSQGAKIAAVAAADHPEIVSVNLLGFNPEGRYEEMIRRERKKLHDGAITGLEYEKNIDTYYRLWKEIQADPNSMEVVWSDPNRTWTSFSIDYVPYLLKIEAPIWVAFGTEDIIAENCDLLQLTFIDAGKNNLSIKTYGGLDHNFFEVENGQPNYEKGHWERVMKHISRRLYQLDRVKSHHK